ncbi:nuclear transport factor 2 family protein [Nocardioides sp. AE5]|uniref:nuclear transport factor 2 family protein n=1 Tax=Nocardioides sp. AE5 TaxID=2962573 RepID=UPI0028817392|nr:nuclear transport factor 2 family protein [Nocardioides sp. AE5]MDT0203206.1 nuclear transport factor 2 family protein [Nocardioides sp. AE5]
MSTDDRTQIIEQLAHVAAMLDQRDFTALEAAFLPDAHGYGTDGAAAIAAQTRDHLGGCGPSQHLLGNHRVTIDGDTAHSLTYARVYHAGAGEMEGKFFECMGEYDDRWVRTPEGWKLSYRRFTMEIMLGDFAVLRP